MPLNSPENEQAEITFTESNEIIDLDLKVEVSSENEGEEEKENGSSFVNTPIRKRAASTGSKLSNKKAKCKTHFSFSTYLHITILKAC